MDLISIIVPVYNVEKYLIRCIESIINQTYKNIEIILVDDGSTDNSSKICDEYKNKDKRIKVIHKINGGLSSARNRGLDIAKGKYIGFVDSDDYISPNMYEILYKELIDNKSDIVVCNFDRKEDFNFVINNYKVKKLNNINVIKENIKNDINYNIYIDDYAWNKLYKKELFKNIRYPIGKYFEDIGTTFKLLSNSKSVIYIDCILYKYIKRTDSILGNPNINVRKDRFDMIDLKCNYLLKKYPILKKEIMQYYVLSYIESYRLLKYINKNTLNSTFFINKYKFIKENYKYVNKKELTLLNILMHKLLLFNKYLYFKVAIVLNHIRKFKEKNEKTSKV